MFTTDDRNLLRALLTLWAGVETLLMRQGFRLDRLDRRLGALERAEEETMATLDDVVTKLTAQTTVVGSVELLLGQLAQMLREAIAAGDPGKVKLVADLIDANTARLSAAVVTNTPAAPTP